jgi:L-2-hydroxyglutarate oxidase LhgO
VETADSVVIGAGVVGLAVARALALRGREVVVLEAERAPGQHASSRNSEVLHAGLYHPPGSLKALLCVAGRPALEAFCAAHGVATARPGKLVVACGEAEVPALRALAERGRANGVTGLRWLDGAEARAMEPELEVAAAFHSPVTGIVDSHGLMAALLGEAEAHGAVLARAAPVTGIVAGEDGLVLEVGGEAPMRLRARSVVNAAGLGATALAARTRGLPAGCVPEGAMARGSYFALRGRAPFRHLIYPLPEPGGAGIHLTLDLAGAARFGPDVEPVSTVDYRVDPGREAAFARAIRRWWPGLPDGALTPAHAGIRAKLGTPHGGGDFRVDGPAVHGVAGLVNLFGIESPGLTACLALAEHAVAMLDA